MKRFIALSLIILSSSAAFAQSYLEVQSQVATSTTSAQVLSANPLRNYALFINRSANPAEIIYLKYSTVHSGTEGVALAAGGSYEPNAPVIIDSVYAKSASGTPALQIITGKQFR